MNKGKIVETGDAETVYTHAQDVYTQAFRAVDSGPRKMRARREPQAEGCPQNRSNAGIVARRSVSLSSWSGCARPVTAQRSSAARTSRLSRSGRWRFAPAHRRASRPGARQEGLRPAGCRQHRPERYLPALRPAKGQWASLPFGPPSARRPAPRSREDVRIGGNGDVKDKDIDGRQVFATTSPAASGRAGLAAGAANDLAQSLAEDPRSAAWTDHTSSSVTTRRPTDGRSAVAAGEATPPPGVFQSGIWVIGGQDARAGDAVWISSPARTAAARSAIRSGWAAGAASPRRLTSCSSQYLI